MCLDRRPLARRCAYCDGLGPLTRDHVWPECFLERFGLEVAKFSVKKSRVYGGDYVVNDVCRKCNSGPLSQVDEYFCALYDEHLHGLHDFNSAVVLRYDFDLLARALLDRKSVV